jgi:hypothetical protein
MRCRILTLVLASLFVLPVAALASAVLPLQEISTSGPSGHSTMQVGGLPALPQATFQNTELATATQTALDRDATTADAFTQPNSGTKLVPITVPGQNLLGFQIIEKSSYLIAELPDKSVAGATLFVGKDSVGDGIPRKADVVCQAQTSTLASAFCLVPVDGSSYWASVQAPRGTAYTSTLDTAVLRSVNIIVPYPGYDTSSGAAVVTGPGHAPANAQFPIRVTWNTSPAPGQRVYGAVMIGGAGYVSTFPPADFIAVQPYALTQSVGRDDINIAMSVPIARGGFSKPVVVSIAPGATLNHWFFDLPPTTDGTNYGPVSFLCSIIPGDITTGAELSLVHANFPAQSDSALVPSAPPIDSTAIPVRCLSPQVGEAQFNQLSPGRWYLVARNTGVVAAQIQMILYNGPSLASVLCPPCTGGGPRLDGGANPTIAPGTYFNYLRSGHGLSLSQASGQQMLFWYTYLEDGTPMWYQAQAAAPDANSGWWQAPLYRVAWDGGSNRLTEVGSVTLTPIATNRFAFTWNLEGQTGSEVFDQLARLGDCPAFNGVSTNFDGAWYAPAQGGYGMDVLALPEQQFNLFYFYDDLGLARWGVGSSLPFASNSTFSFNQNSGFCPSCAYSPAM